MKNFIVTKVLLVLALCSLGTIDAHSQTMSDLHNRGKSLIDLLVDMDEEIVHVEYDLIFSDPKEVFRTLSKGYKYRIMGFADETRVSDLDLYVYRKSGNQWVEVDHDSKTDATPLVTISPETTTQYKFVIKVYSYKQGYDRSCWGIIISHNN